MRRRNQDLKRLFQFILVLALIGLAGFQTRLVSAKPTEPPEEPTRERAGIQTGSAGLAWGDPDGPHSVYGWPFSVVQMGHVIQSYQYYGGAPYFHHGIDMLAPNGTEVVSRSGGQVVNIENYNYGELYWEVAILDAEGYVWQYHHIAQPSIPTEIYLAYQAWQADPEHGGFILPNTKLGEIVSWPIWSFGYPFNHIHLNILADGDVYLNPLEFHTLLPDNQTPVIEGLGLTLNNSILTRHTIAEPEILNYGLYAHAGDLFLSPVYTLPPYKIAFSLDGGAWITLWEFHNFPGGSNDTQLVDVFFISPPTCGDYDCREFYIDLGFTMLGERRFPSQNGPHTVEVQVWDYNQNSALDTYSWTVTHPSSVVYTGLSAEYTPAGNLIQWSASTLGDALGFNLYRSETLDGPKTKLNASLIPRGAVNDAQYAYTDASAALGQAYWYWLEDQDAYGPTGVLYGPQMVQTGLLIYLPILQKNAEN